MKKRFLVIMILVFSTAMLLFGCKKKHNWHEVNGETAPAVEHFGVQTSKGTESNPAKVYPAIVYVPTGRDENGIQNFETVMYEMEELTPENLNAALVHYGVVSEDSLFVDFTTELSNKEENAGPGAIGQVKNLDGTVRYVDLDSPLENSDEYVDPSTGDEYTGKKAVGLIDIYDIYDAVCNTFAENFNLVECGFSPANMEDYEKANNK